MADVKGRLRRRGRKEQVINIDDVQELLVKMMGALRTGASISPLKDEGEEEEKDRTERKGGGGGDEGVGESDVQLGRAQWREQESDEAKGGGALLKPSTGGGVGTA